MSSNHVAQRRRSGPAVLLVVGATAVLVLVVALLHGRSESDDAQIGRVVTTFASAVDLGDQAGLLTTLCAEEASALAGDDDYDPDALPLPSRPDGAAVQIEAVTVHDDVAQVVVQRSGTDTVTLYLAMESGAWKVCASAADRFGAT